VSILPRGYGFAVAAPHESRLDRNQVILLVAVATYVAASLMANIMSVRLVRVAGFSIDAGTLTYPLTFTLRDVVHKIGGRSAARVTIVTTALLNIMLALGLWAAATLPPDPAVGPQREFGQVLLSTWRIIAASIIAQVISELVDTEAYQLFVRRFGHRAQWGRVIVSNAVSIPVDSVIFVTIAFGGSIPRAVAVSIIWANIVVKGLTSLVSWPLIYVVKSDTQVPEGAGEPHGVEAAVDQVVR